MSGAFGVRGGFDSHAFPPSLLLAAALLLAAPAAAAPPPGAPYGPPAPPLDSLVTPPPPDTSAAKVVEVGRTPPAPRAAARSTPRFGKPRWVMLRSLAVPGWGQLYNGSWLKAALVAGVEGWLIAGLIDDERALDRFSRRVDEAQAAQDEEAYDAAVLAYNDRLDQSINRRWLLGGALAYALLDAYVDAHFRNFDVEFQQNPALPPGYVPPRTGKRSGGARMSLRWSF
jgi:hypothetical protein